jgi:hypothetical protein
MVFTTGLRRNSARLDLVETAFHEGTLVGGVVLREIKGG